MLFELNSHLLEISLDRLGCPTLEPEALCSGLTWQAALLRGKEGQRQIFPRQERERVFAARGPRRLQARCLWTPVVGPIPRGVF